MIPENNHKVLDIVTSTIAVSPLDDIDENDSPEESEGTVQQDPEPEARNSTAAGPDSEHTNENNSISSESQNSEGGSGTESPSSSSTNSTSSDIVITSLDYPRVNPRSLEIEIARKMQIWKGSLWGTNCQR
jgi:hypothetical protein